MENLSGSGWLPMAVCCGWDIELAIFTTIEEFLDQLTVY